MHYKNLLIPFAAVACGATTATPTPSPPNQGAIMSFLNSPFWGRVAGFGVGALIAAQANKYFSSSNNYSCPEPSSEEDKFRNAVREVMASHPDAAELTTTFTGFSGKEYTLTIKRPEKAESGHKVVLE